MPRMNDVTLLRAIREQPPAPVYLIYGSETYYSGVCLDRLLGKLVKKVRFPFSLVLSQIIFPDIDVRLLNVLFQPFC